MLYIQALLKNKPLFLVMSALFTAVFFSSIILQPTAFAASAGDWFQRTGTTVTEDKVWDRNGVDPDVGVATAFAYIITTDNGLNETLDGEWNCAKNADTGDQKAIDDFAMLIKTGYYNDDKAVDSVFPGKKAKDFEPAAATIITTTINSYGAIDNDNNSRCTFVANLMRDHNLIYDSADQSRAELAAAIAKECGPVWSEGMDAAEAISYYNVLLMSYSSSDWKNKIEKPWNMNSGANRCSEIDNAAKITSLTPDALKKAVEDACKGNTEMLNKLDSFTDLQIAKAYSKIKDGKSCKQAVNFAASDGTTPVDTPPDTSKTSCNIDGIGWLVCPVMNFLAEVNEKAFGFLQSLLGIRPSLLQDKGTVEAWSKFRDLANVAFVIAFVVIIYSQITSVGVSNYGIKKLLPKIAIAAIMVNLSLFFCQILVDVSNIAGASLYSFISGLVPGLESTLDGTDTTWTTIMTGVLAAGVGVLLVVLVVTAPTVLLALGMILLILVARQAFILILVILSPLAFVAYLLPNTEGMFKKWWKALSAALLVYPIVAVVFGASTLASNILMGIASDDGNIKGGDDNQMLAIVALAVMAVPLFAVPVILKSAMSGAGAIGAKLASLQDRANSHAKNKAAEESKYWGNRASSAMLSNNGRFARFNRALTRTGARADRKVRLETAQKQREAIEETYAHRDGSRSASRKAAVVDAQETASLSKQIVENQAKQRHLDNNHDLHGRATRTGLDLHNAEETHKNQVGAAHMAENPGQYDALNASRGIKQNAELETTRRFEASATGQTLGVQRQGLEDQVATAKATQKQTYNEQQSVLPVSQSLVQQRKAAEGAAKNAEQFNELIFQDSTDGRGLAQEQKTIEGELEIVHGEQKNNFEASSTGQAQAQQKKTIQGEAKFIEGTAQLAYETSPEGISIEKDIQSVQSQVSTAQTATKAAFTASRSGKARNLESAVAQATLGAAEAANKAQVDELKAGAEAAGVVGTSLEQVAIDLSAADIQTRAQTQRSASAQNVANTEYSGKVRASENVPGGLADISGGIDPYGASRAVAVATQIWDKQLVEAIGAQKTLFESTPGNKLEAEYKTGFVDGDPTKGRSSPERMAAVAGTIASRGYMGGKLELLKATGPALKKAKADARARGLTTDEEINSDPAVSAIIFSQKQIAADMKEWPFGASDTMRDKLGLGQWEDDFEAGFQTRIGTKLNGPKLGSLKAEELADLEAIFPSLTPEQRASLDNAVKEAKTNETVRKDIKPEIWNALERMGYSRP